MLIVTTDEISGKELEMLGIVRGSTIQTKNMFRDMSQGFKTMVGGELKSYTDMMNKARDLATERMVGEAEKPTQTQSFVLDIHLQQLCKELPKLW